MSWRVSTEEVSAWTNFSVIAWRCADMPLGEALLSGQGGLNVAGRLKADDWNGRRGVQFEIEDIHDPRRV